MNTVMKVPLYGDGNDQHAKLFPDERYLLSAAASKVVQVLSPTDKRRARAALTRFFELSEQNRSQIHYTQARPFDSTVDPTRGFRGDCSSYATQAFNYVRTKTGIPLHDPNGTVEWDGYGFTGTLLSTNHRYPVPDGRIYFVGDIAICGTFWNTVHAFFCKKGGNANDSRWSSHGSEAGPREEKLNYRPDVLGVFRPISLH